MKTIDSDRRRFLRGAGSARIATGAVSSYSLPAGSAAVDADKNVALTVERIRQRSPILRDMADSGKIGLAGAMYDVHTGIVTFL